MKDELRKKEQLKEVAARKQEKLDEAKARARVKADIAATQQARREAAERAKAEREGRVIEEARVVAPVVHQPKAATTHTEARLRIQFPPNTGRAPLTKTFAATATLFEVAAAVAEETGTEVNTLTTTFPPRKTFNIQDATDVGLSLKEANLTPSASLMVG